MTETVTRRSVLAGLAAGVAIPPSAAATAAPTPLESLMVAYQAALEEYVSAADAQDAIELSIPDPRVEIGRYISLDGGEDRAIFAESPNEILEFFRSHTAGLVGEEKFELCRKRDARLAEFCEADRAHDAAMEAAGHAAACERSRSSGVALSTAEDAILAYRPVDMADARAKARFVLTMPAFEDEPALLAFAASLA